ncbi:CaiB/BaiF CoA-transferase family protein [Variovorax sp. Sphag1AA]|uniref:CaiB/BaiF CoA transferase family protein n=1 Tax=Variovorax sp. Sphag1AA TaxID=2587027 RepID=UPI001614132E|nr:CoA transferase [Variovorax sp. Sphag1AA]MBB3181098.1 crotonobetainyl-CoA:carnitine CoA-transferase CaiB-like acyl-CoA transferase [Variovorax sp. Sphag1AA]
MSTPESTLPFTGLPLRSAPALDLLAGVKVLDLTSSVAGPYAGQLLADMGATVVKVEKPKGGDDARAWGPPFLHGESLWFMSVNRGKQSLTLDIAVPQGQEILKQLVAQCDVVLLNLVARAQRKLGLDAASLRPLNPRLIHVSVSGFGLQGSRADLPCYDLIAEGYSSVMDLTGEPENGPQKVGTPAADLLAGSDAAMAVLAALLRREREGKGCDIDISMVESMSRFMTPKLMPYLGSGDLARRAGGRDSVIAIYQVFETADGPMTLGLGNDAIWKRFWEAVGRPEVAAEPEFASNAQRRAKRDDIVKVIAELLQTQPRAHWLALLAKARVPAGPIQRVDEVAQDPALHESGFIYRAQGPRGDIPQVGLGIRFDGRTEGTNAPPPKLGAHTEQILSAWLQCDATRIEQLRAQQII